MKVSTFLLGAVASLGIPATSETLAVTLNSPETFQSQLQPCPATCNSHDPQDWTVYGSFERLSFCQELMLFDFAIHTPINDTSSILKFRACTSRNGQDQQSGGDTQTDLDSVYDSNAIRESSVTLQLSQIAEPTGNMTSVEEDATSSMLIALAEMQGYLRAGRDCTKNIILSYYNQVVVGVYGGQALGKNTIVGAVDQLLAQVEDGPIQAHWLLQLCGAGGTQTIQGACADEANDGTTTSLANVSIWEVPQRGPVNQINSTVSNSTTALALDIRRRHLSLLPREATYCKKLTVVSGDTCTTLAQACGITLAKFYTFNSQAICTNLQIGSKVCCNSGYLKPQPYDNGTCYTYTTHPGDTCYDIGVAWSLKASEIEGFNDKTTWGWSGCDNLGTGQTICLSAGNAPMPAPLANAICGPQVPGTKVTTVITDASDLATLNPCPLNACCNIWGQCGIDAGFCTKSTGVTGNPGTSQPGIDGCISNCGTAVVNKDVSPASGFQRVGYYEAFNWDRECLHLRAEWANTVKYTHLHWAFGYIGEDLSVYVNDSYHQWDGFMGIKNVKKIVSFGGWGFSTDPATFTILRKSMNAANRAKFVQNLVAFAEATGIDGIDLDWEYPGAPDIPGIPKGLATDGPNYLATLKALRAALPVKYSLSIAAPASYWYLKAFPIAEMAEVVDYIVYMAYDLHGQWDYGNMYAQVGCPTGNCLRSHVNQTEVRQTLAMITKAGVLTNKIMVGESSYGRSFKMAAAGCTGPDCRFTGTNATSNATPGRCTNTGGYLANAEIEEIIAKGGDAVTTWHDVPTASDYLVYNDLQWVAYMNANTKENRRATWQNLNFLGTVDWAVDLQDFSVADTVGPTGQYNKSSCVNVFDNMIWDWANPVIEAVVGCTNIIQPSTLATTVTRTARSTLTLISGTSLSTTVVTTVFSISEVSYQPFTINPTDTASGSVITYNPVPRITPSPLPVQIPAGWTITTLNSKVDHASTSPPSLVGLSTKTTTTTTSGVGGFITFITWSPTVSYSLPSFVTPKSIAPTAIPEDDNSPTPTPNPGVVDCLGDDSCVTGHDCTEVDNCTRGGDCRGPNCIRGGHCSGPKCIRGGSCVGLECQQGGNCEGDRCVTGGGCKGPKCRKGGDCSGSDCDKGGGCMITLLKNCSPGNCNGKGCGLDINCPACDNKITITVHGPGGGSGNTNPTPKPTCLTNCPSLSPCPNGDTSCNKPCNMGKCPASSMPTDKACTDFTTASDCTEIVSSTAILTTPTTSYSTTTRTRCETIVDCDVQDMTITTTITTSHDPDPTVTAMGIYDFWADYTIDQNFLDTLESEYEEWERTGDIRPTTTTKTTKTTTTTQVSEPTFTADCYEWNDQFYWRFEIFNIIGWAADGGSALHDEESGCGAMTGWDWTDATDDTPAFVYFNLPLFMAAGCVERAIVSAGGPEISCLDESSMKRARDWKLMHATYRPMTEEQIEEAELVYGSDLDNLPEYSHYVPMDWEAWHSSHPYAAYATPTG